MRDNISWLKLTIAILAAWRITHLIAKEDGPGNIVYKIRKLLGSSLFGSLMDCYKCTSVWVAIPLAYYVTTYYVDFIVVWLAISAGACLLYYQQDFYDNKHAESYFELSDYNCNSVLEKLYMSCCGNKRNREFNSSKSIYTTQVDNDNHRDLQTLNSTLKRYTKVKYNGKGVINITGELTNQQYVLSESVPVINIDSRDAGTFARNDKFVIIQE
jgi:hypothetical protein